MTVRLAALLASMLVAMPAKAERIVSLNLCADEYLLLLAPEKAAAVTFLARDPTLSVVAAAASHVPTVRADAEAVLLLHPDLVLAGNTGAQSTLALIARRGIRIERIAEVHDFPGIRAQTRQMSTLLGHGEAADELLAAMDSDLAHPAPHPARALALAPRGYSSGPGSLTDAVLRATGLTNVGTGAQLPLEMIVTHPPDLLVLSRDPDFPSLATEFLRHPVLRGIPRRELPPSLLTCGGPWSARAVALLVD